MPTPLARLLRALGGGRLSPDALRQIPRAIISCTDPLGPDFDAPVRALLNDLAPDEAEAYAKHLAECEFCREMHTEAAKRDLAGLREILADFGVKLNSPE